MTPKKNNKFSFNRKDTFKKKPKSKYDNRKISLDEIPEISENVSELVEHAKLATYQMFIISKKISILCLQVCFGYIHDAFSLCLKVILEVFKRIILVLIFVYLFLLNLCPKRKGKNPFNNKSKGEILKKLDKIWKTKKLTIVLDLDHTLIKTSRTKLSSL